jgi:hypothetical protein
VTKRLSPELVARAVANASLEWKLVDPLAFGLTTASPLQRAICRIADGLPLNGLANEPTVVAALGNVYGLPQLRPREMVVLSGIRTAKSLIAACGAFHMAMTCDVSSLRPGEIPRVSVVSLKKDLADVIMNHLVGSVKASPLLRPFMMGDPTGDGVMFRHPTGTPIEVCIAAGSRAGASLVARWSAGCIFDEFPRMVGGEEGVVNWDDMRQAVLLRMLKGCQLWHIGSPWAPYGPAYETVTEHHGKPTEQRVVIRAPAPAMNPVLWTPEKCAEAKAADEDAYKTDVLAEFATPEEAMFSSESIDKCTRKAPVFVERKPGNTYYAAMDPATRGNGWTLAIATREQGKTVVVRAEEWVGSRDEPLDPGEVLKQVAKLVMSYGISTVHSDQVMGDALVVLARQAGLSLAQWTYSGTERAKKYLAIRTHLDRGAIELPPIMQMRTDLLHIRKQVTPGGMQPKLPMTSDGRHCDWGPTLMLVLSKLLPDPDPPPKGPAVDDETARMREIFLKRCGGRKDEW